MSKVTHVEVRLYRMGTGDIFALRFFDGKKNENPSFKMLIDGGNWTGAKDHLKNYVNDLKNYVKGYVDVLVITHEHKDHVCAFDVYEELFCDGNFNVGEVWFGWTENDKIKNVKEWKNQYGEKKKVLGLAAQKLAEVIDSEEYKKQFKDNRHSTRSLDARKNFSDVLKEFAGLPMSVTDEKTDRLGLDEIELPKTEIKFKEVKYFVQGDIISDLRGLEGIKIYVLSPPKLYKDLKEKEKEESYGHNDILKENPAFAAAVLNFDDDLFNEESNLLLPFDEHYIMPETEAIQNEYYKTSWRRIDADWLYSVLALRMNRLTNTLGLALAIEFESGKVMLFPRDAEYGDWAGWQNISWDQQGKEGRHVTEDLLNRTVFFKVPSHVDYNGTIEKPELEMMKSNDLVAMAAWDNNVISNGWKSSIPNEAILKALLEKTKGRLILTNEEGLFYDANKEISLSEKIAEARTKMTQKEREEFVENLVEGEGFVQFRVEV